MTPGSHIVKYPHPALRYPARPVVSIDGEIRRYAGRMIELMHANEGLGLAGPQIALPLQIIVMRFDHDPDASPEDCVAINPVIIERHGVQEGTEGCLSFPELYQKVRRARTVTAQAYNLDGALFEMTCSDLSARLWQHEIDHLHGKLFIDMMSPLGKLSSRGALKEFERTYQNAQKKGELETDAELLRQLKAFEPGAAPVL